MISSIFWSILFQTISVCLVLTLFCIIIPLEEWQRASPLLSYIIRESHIEFKENLSRNMLNKQVDQLVYVYIKFSSVILSNNGAVIALLICCFHFPTVKGLTVL